ncbi:MAG TPA: pseudouridine synthase [Gammaproteobacteria bacterium]
MNRPRKPGATRQKRAPRTSPSTDAAAPPPERLQKLLARVGLGSRREIEGWIAAGRLSVDGKPAVAGQAVTGRERFSLDGRPLRVTPERIPAARVIAYHKPVGEVVARRDPDGRPTVFAALPRLPGGRWVAVGRLDLNTAGLLLLTSDGTLAHKLMHPSSEVEREYAVRVLGEVADADLQRLTQGVTLDDGPAAFDSVTIAGGEGANHWYHVVLREGRKREVRRLWEALGVTVSRLIRVRYGPVRLERKLRPGTWRELHDGELGMLYAAASLPLPTGSVRGAAPRQTGTVASARGAREQRPRPGGPRRR